MIRQLVRRTLSVAPLVILGNAAFFLASVLAARVLMPEEFALYSAQIGIIAVLATAMSGVQLDIAHSSSSGSRTESPIRRHWSLHGIPALIAILTVLICALLPLLARLWDETPRAFIALTIAPASVVVGSAVNGILQGRREFRRLFGISFALGLLRIGTLMAALVRPVASGALVLAMLVGSTVIYLLVGSRNHSQSLLIGWKASKRFATLSVTSLALWAMIYGDLLLIRRFADGDLAGSLAAILTVVKGSLALPILLGQLLFPEFADTRTAAPQKKRAVWRLAIFAVCVGSAVSLVVGAGGPWLLTAVYGVNVLPSGSVIWVSSASVISLSLMIVLGNFAMSAVSHLFAAVMVVASLVYFFTGAFAVQNVEQLVILSVVAPLAPIAFLALATPRILRWDGQPKANRGNG